MRILIWLSGVVFFLSCSSGDIIDLNDKDFFGDWEVVGNYGVTFQDSSYNIDIIYKLKDNFDYELDVDHPILPNNFSSNSYPDWGAGRWEFEEDLQRIKYYSPKKMNGELGETIYYWEIIDTSNPFIRLSVLDGDHNFLEEMFIKKR